MDEKITVCGEPSPSLLPIGEKPIFRHTSWRKIFAHLAPHLVGLQSEAFAKATLTEFLFGKSYEYELRDTDFQIIKVQFVAHNWISLKSHGWMLTEKGYAVMLEVVTVRTGSSSKSESQGLV